MLDDVDESWLEATRRRVAEKDQAATRIIAQRWTKGASDLPSINGDKKQLSRVKDNSCAQSSPHLNYGLLAGSLLEGLYKDVAQRMDEDEGQRRELELARHNCSEGLKEVFTFLRQLVSSLNILKPLSPDRFFLLNTEQELREMSWHEGWVDQRSFSEREGGGVQSVTIVFERRGNGERVIVRDNPGSISSMTRFLFDHGLQFEVAELRNKKGQVEKATFSIKNSVRSKAVWRLDERQGFVCLDLINFSRLGIDRLMINVEDINDDSLNDFGLMVMGKPNCFKRHVSSSR